MPESKKGFNDFAVTTFSHPLLTVPELKILNAIAILCQCQCHLLTVPELATLLLQPSLTLRPAWSLLLNHAANSVAMNVFRKTETLS